VDQAEALTATGPASRPASAPTRAAPRPGLALPGKIFKLWGTSYIWEMARDKQLFLIFLHFWGSKLEIQFAANGFSQLVTSISGKIGNI
jgi:hypothetical protein